MKNGLLPALLSVVLTACTSMPSIAGATATHFRESTLPTFPKETSTIEPAPLADLGGILFFDYNGSGLQEGNEPGLSNLKVCTATKNICATTDGTGHYVFEHVAAEGSKIQLSIVDPNADNPGLAFRYINVWNQAVTIDAYEIGGVQVAEQHLNDTTPLAVNEGFGAVVGKINATGLMQGFLTLPFIQSEVPSPLAWTYFDVLNKTESCGEPVPRDGVAGSFDGQYAKIGDPFVPRVGVGDSHTGIDYIVRPGTLVIHAAPKSQVWLLDKRSDGELMASTKFLDPDGGGLMYTNTYAHLGAQFVKLGQLVYRGQIVALSGDTGANNTFSGYGKRRVPQLHFDLTITTPNGCNHYLDPYRYTVPVPRSGNFSGSESSFWTLDNSPQFAR